MNVIPGPLLDRITTCMALMGTLTTERSTKKARPGNRTPVVLVRGAKTVPMLPVPVHSTLDLRGQRPARFWETGGPRCRRRLVRD